MQTALGVRTVSFYQGDYGSDPSLEQQAASGAFPLPDGFARGYTANTAACSLALDSRQPRPAPGSGIRVELVAEQGGDVRQAAGSGWLGYGATAGGLLRPERSWTGHQPHGG